MKKFYWVSKEYNRKKEIIVVRSKVKGCKNRYELWAQKGIVNDYIDLGGIKNIRGLRNACDKILQEYME